MSTVDQDHPGRVNRRGRVVRTAFAAVLLAGTAIGGWAIATPGAAQQTATPSQDHVIHPTPPPAELPNFIHLVKQVEPAVVSITTRLKSSAALAEMQQQEGQQPEMPFGLPFGFGVPQQMPRHAIIEARGSGFIIDPNGFIVTNNHVVNGAKTVSVTLSDGMSYPAKIIGTDPRTDLALLKISVGHKLPSVELGNSAQVEPGQWVIAIGNPYGLGDTVTAGIVSALGRDIGSGPYDNFLQVDAPINKGNSGGPLFTQNGDVVGVTTAILSPTGGSIGIGFAIPSNTVQAVISQLKTTGHVVRGYLGVEAQPVAKPIAEALNLPKQEGPDGKPEGALIASVQPNSPAERAGLKPGDVIEQVDGQTIANPRALAVHIANIKPGSPAKIEVIRDGKAQSFDITVATLPSERMASNSLKDQGADEDQQAKVGLALQPLTPELRQQLDLPSHTRGAVVAEVQPGSPADQAGIQAGDVIMGVGSQPVNDPEQAAEAIKHAVKQHHAVALRVMRNGQAVFVALDMNHAKPGAEDNSQG